MDGAVLTGIGECMVELSPAGAGLFRMGFAGDVFNSLWYARAHLPGAVQVRFHSGFGDDDLSARMRGFMEAHGIATGSAVTVPGRSPGLYLVELEAGERRFRYWRETSAARAMLSDPAALARATGGAHWIYLSGITLAILSPPDRAALMAHLARRRTEGAQIAFDPNIRMRLWPDPATLRAAVTEGARVATVVLPGFEDEAQAFGDATPAETARRYRALGAGLVAVKDAARPVFLSTPGAEAMLPVADPVAPLDSTAAGDSFNGAFLAALIRGQSAREAVAAGQACARVVVSLPGALADPALFRRG